MSEPKLEIINPSKTDAAVAADLKRDTGELLKKVAALLDEANRHGMRIQFQLGVDGFGRNVVANLDVMKVL